MLVAAVQLTSTADRARNLDGAVCLIREAASLGAGMIFKGSGFYETDYKRGGKNDRAAESCPAAEKSGSAPAASWHVVQHLRSRPARRPFSPYLELVLQGAPRSKPS